MISANTKTLLMRSGFTSYYDLEDDSGTLMNARWAATRTFGPLQRLLHTGAHLGIWDDHDYGPNNSDRTFALKEISLALFKRYWVNRGFGLPGAPGVFSKVTLSDVDFFLLDGRYYRDADASPPSPEMTMFGARQLEWLKEELRRSTANFKLIANGSRLLTEKPSPTDRGGEGWHNFPRERAAFLDWLRAQRIDGIFFLSGDIHYTHLTQRERPGTYTLTELTCSPLTSRVHPRPFPVTETPGTLVTHRNFCTLEVTGPSRRRVLAISSRDAAGTIFWREEISASALRTPVR
jgi:alkaline phosphatase D